MNFTDICEFYSKRKEFHKEIENKFFSKRQKDAGWEIKTDKTGVIIYGNYGEYSIWKTHTSFKKETASTNIGRCKLSELEVHLKRYSNELNEIEILIPQIQKFISENS